MCHLRGFNWSRRFVCRWLLEICCLGVVCCVGGGVDGKYNVYVAMRLSEGVEGDVFEVFAAVNKCKALFLSDFEVELW